MVGQLLTNSERYFYHPVKKIVYFYAHYQEKLFEPLIRKFGVENVEFIPCVEYNGSDFFSNRTEKDEQMICVFDDCSNSLFNHDMKHVIDVKIHHCNLIVLIISHNLVSSYKPFGEISRNCHYLVLWDNYRTRHNFRALSRSMFNDPNLIIESLETINRNLPPLASYSNPVLLDFRSNVKNVLRLRSVLFDDIESVCLFLPQHLVDQ